MATLIKNTTFFDVYGNQFAEYTANAGDLIKVKVDFSNCCCITSSQTQQIIYSQLTGEVKISEGSWIDEGFRIGDNVTFEGFNNLNVSTGSYNLVITAIPTDKIIVVTGLPAFNNASPTAGYTWQFWVNKQKEEMQLSVNWLENNNTSQTPSMNSLIDGESQRLALVGMNLLSITNGVGVGTSLTQVGKKSGSFGISNPKIWRYDNDLYGGATRYNYSITYDVVDFGMLFPSLYQGSECLKLAMKLALKTQIGDTKTSDLYAVDNGNTGFYNEAYNADISQITTFPNLTAILPFNTIKQIPFSVTINNTTTTKFEIGACYSTVDDTYNENQFDSQNKYLKLLKSGLIDTANIGNTFFSDAFTNDFYTIKLLSLTSTVSGGSRTFTGVLEFNSKYSDYTDSFGKFIESRGDSDRNFYLWLKVGNTNCLLFGGQMTFQFPIGVLIEPEFVSIINHDDNSNHSDMGTAGIVGADDVNIEDDLAYISDVFINETDINSAIQVEIVCIDQFTTQEFTLEKMSYDISTQNLNFWNNLAQNVSNNLPLDSAKKQSYLNFKQFEGDGIVVRLYYPFLIRWEYWLKQLNATAYFVSTSKNNRKWTNYADSTNGKLYVKIGIVRNGVMDYHYQLIEPKIYDFDTNVVSTIELIDNTTNTVSESIIKGRTYTVTATHNKIVGDWVQYPYGQITVEQKESAPRFMVSTEVDADISNFNPLIGNVNRRLDEVRPNAKTVIYSCIFDTTNISGTNYCFTSKISERATNNNPIFALKITEDGEDKLTEDLILKQIE